MKLIEIAHKLQDCKCSAEALTKQLHGIAIRAYSECFEIERKIDELHKELMKITNDPPEE